MAKTAKLRRRPRPIRTDRQRAAGLLSVLALFVAGFAAIVWFLGAEGIKDLAPTLSGLLMAMLGVGITVLVTTFSFVFVALSLVSVQFSPRVVRHFWHADRFRAIFLWTFIAIFGFCFVGIFVASPMLHLAALTLSAYAVFVMFPVFLGYLADNLNAASVTHNIANLTLSEIARDYGPLDFSVQETETDCLTIFSEKCGFMERVDTERLTAVFSNVRARSPEATIRTTNYLGSFVEVGSPLARIEPRVDINSRTESEIRNCFSLHKFRSIDQDIEYGIRQLADIGIKAISPAINDPTTCVNCIHYLGVIIKDLAGRESRSIKSLKLEKHGILIKEPSFEQYIDDAFDQIYQFGRKDHVIVKSIVSVLAEIMSSVGDPERAAVVVREIEEMELTALYTEHAQPMFPLIENRNYVRNALARFYRVAGEKFEAFDMSDKAAGCRRSAESINGSLGV